MSGIEPLSCYLLTYNSEVGLGGALLSLRQVADEIVVIDSGSTDLTKQIALSAGARVIYRKFEGFSAQRAYAVTQCRYPWVLSIDSDEVVSESLANRILELKRCGFRSETTCPDAFGIRREWYLLGRKIHCFYPSRCPDQPIRLFKKDHVQYSASRHVHENMTAFARSESIDEPIMHYTCNTIDQMYCKLNLYSTLAAKDFIGLGGRSSFLKIMIVPWLLWFRWYVSYGGWRDGRVGLIHARYVRDMAYQKYLKARHDFSPDQGDHPVRRSPTS